MSRLKIFLICILTCLYSVAYSQVKIRVFSDSAPETVLFTVNSGQYEINAFAGEPITIPVGEPVIFSLYHGRLAVKVRHLKGFISDSVIIRARTGDDSFSLRIYDKNGTKRDYSGDLRIMPDLGTIVLINTCDIEKYIAGVVMAEGGSGKNIEYFKSQAVIARTYMYKYFDKHSSDMYNVCDNTHCQAFNGLSSDPVLNEAAMDTRGLVILDKGRTLITAAFHSNCGGETSSSEDVWLTSLPYLKSVKDPYCIKSRNAEWQKDLTLESWISYLQRRGYNGKTDDPVIFNFFQESRSIDYIAGSFRLPLKTIRADLDLRSTFFSVISLNNTIILKGRGYGHGVGLCQEGAMMMAVKGFDYRQIIDFYYSGVSISDIKNAVVLTGVSPSASRAGNENKRSNNVNGE